MNLSDIIGIIGLFFAIIAIIISIYQFKKYKTSPLTELEIKVIDKLIDKIIALNYSLTYFTYLEKLNIRKAFSLMGNYISLGEQIESKIEKKATEYPLIACEDYIQNNYFKKFSKNKFLSQGLRKNLSDFNFKFEEIVTTEKELIESTYNFALLDQNNPVNIIMSIGKIPYRRASIRKGKYKYILKENERMKANDFKKIINEIDKELIKWLNEIGKKHMYEKKKRKLKPNKELNKAIRKIRKEIDKNLSVDIFSVKENSELHLELKELMRNNVS